MMPDGAAREESREAVVRGEVGALGWQGLRSAFLLRPDWQAVSSRPGIIAGIVVARFWSGSF